jgi:hypothetical protein
MGVVLSQHHGQGQTGRHRVGSATAGYSLGALVCPLAGLDRETLP